MFSNGTITKERNMLKVQSQYDTETEKPLKEKNPEKIKSQSWYRISQYGFRKIYSKAQQWWNQFSGFMSTIGGQTIKDQANIFKIFGMPMLNLENGLVKDFQTRRMVQSAGTEFLLLSKTVGKQLLKLEETWGWIKNTGAGIGGWFSSQGQNLLIDLNKVGKQHLKRVLIYGAGLNKQVAQSVDGLLRKVEISGIA